MANTRRLLLVDASTIMYRACHVHRGLSSASGEFTGGVFGFLGQVCTAILKTGATELLVVLDSPPYRKEADMQSVFKGDRKASSDPDLQEKVATTKKQVKQLLARTGIPHFALAGAEADDVIGHICKTCPDVDCVIASGDSDMYQLLSENVSMHKGGKHPVFYTHKDFTQEFGVLPKHWVNIISAAGSHNNVPGVRKGVAIKTALKFLGPNANAVQWMTEDEYEVYRRNVKLNRLPYKKIRPELADASITTMWTFYPAELYRAAGLWDIRITQVMQEALEQVSSAPKRKSLSIDRGAGRQV